MVGVIAPAGPVDPERVAAGVAALEREGLRPCLGAHVLRRQGYLAGSDEQRHADLDAMLVDERVRAVFAARGGYGSQRIVPRIDWPRLAADPKPIVGFSDVTALLAGAVAAGVVAIHGPMVGADLARGVTERSRAWLHSLLTDPAWQWEAEVPVAIRPGRAQGRLVGGCLSVLVALLGTPWAPDTEGAVLFLEDTNEYPYRLDRLLTQLRQAGRLDGVAGVVFGTMAACRPLDGLGALDVIRTCFADAPFPVGVGLPAGHATSDAGVENLALPLGVAVDFDAARGRLTALEAAVV